jgi:hypothetical protein
VKNNGIIKENSILNARSSVLLGKLILAIYETRRFITVFTTAHHWSLS